MKKIAYSLLVLIMLTLTACAGQARAAHNADTRSVNQLISFNKSASSTASTDTLTTDFDNAEPVITQMILGLLKLDGTDLALTNTQATSLLTLWDEYQTAIKDMMPDGGKPGDKPSGTPAAMPTRDPNATPEAPKENAELTAKLDTIVTNMQAVLTDKQVAAIKEMKITRDIAATIMKEKSISDSGPDQQNGQSGQQQGGQLPAGGQQGGQPPAGGPQGGQDGQPPAGGPQQGGQSGQQQGGQPGMDGQPRGNGMVQPGLLKAFTEYLEKVSGTKSTVAFEPAGFSPAGVSSGRQGGPGMPGGQGGPGDSSVNVTYGAFFSQKGGTESKSDQIINATEPDQSGVMVTDSGTLNLTKSKIITSGDTSSQDSSSFVGLNAAVLATGASTINLTDSTIITTGTGANGAFAVGERSSVALSNVIIDATADGAHGVMATKGGTVSLKDVDITTRGQSSGALATDRGSGTITAEGSAITTSGMNSPAIYSTGVITVTNAVMSATGAESAVIEGANSIDVRNSTLTSSKEDKWGVMIYQSMSGDAEGTRGTFNMSGGELSNTASKGPLFFITNSTGIINLKDVTATAASGELILAGANRWGNEGKNGGNVVLNADSQNLAGSVSADSISSIEINLRNNSSLKGAVNPANTAKAIKLTLDGNSIWNVTANSYISSISDPDGITGTTVTNIKGNGFTVYYNVNGCPELGGKTYTLSESGTLTPAP